MRSLLLACALGALLAACAQPRAPSRDTVVLLPEKDGRQTAVIVHNGGKEVTLDTPYAGARTGAADVQGYKSTPAEVQAAFGPALAALPPRPLSFQLYFVEGGDVFTDETKRTVERIFSEIARRPAPEIAVVGHTDRVGSDQSNDALSLRRAELVRRELISRGIAPENIQASGRGEREPLVPTAKGITEPRNRRVEIIVR
jgi:outer membrane protein OmpA-like peptidoglycan-associated protein